jgi:hypothetical protein
MSAGRAANASGFGRSRGSDLAAVAPAPSIA